MLAAADDLDHLMDGGELPDLSDRRNGLLHGGRGILVDAAADLADQEGHDLVGAMAVQAGDIGVARGEAMDEALLDQEVERAIDRDRREAAPTGGRNPVGEIVGSDRTMICVERLQGLGADRRQAQAALPADALRPCQGLGRMKAVVMRMPAAGLAASVLHVMHMLVIGAMRV